MRDESETAARIAYEAKAEFMKEENARAGMRAAMREFLSHNENNRKAKEAEKAAVAALDAKYAAEYAAILDKQEAKRTEQLEKLKKIQARAGGDRKSQAFQRSGIARPPPRTSDRRPSAPARSVPAPPSID